MSSKIDRRQFVRNLTCGMAGSCVLGSVAHAIEPIPRDGKTKFKYSLAAYSYRDLFKGEKPQATLFDFIADCAKMGLEGTELTSYYFPKDVTQDYLLQIKKRCFELGLDISGTAVGNDFGWPAGEKRQAQIALVKRWVDHAEFLGAPVIRVFAGHAKPDSTPEQAHKLMVEGLEECCDYAGKHGVFLALENHGGPTATADGLLQFVRDVKSPWFGVNLDTGNFRGDDVYAEMVKVAPYAVNVQVKVVVAGADGKKQPADFQRLAKIMRDAAYRGYIVLEYEEAADPRTECPKFMDQIRAAFA
jgi:sugar phosphate isomerase/epimerase